LYHQLNKHVSIFSGMYASQYFTYYERKGSFQTERPQEVVAAIQYFLDGSVDTEYTQGIMGYQVDYDFGSWHRHSSISIPIGIAVHTDLDKKWSFQNDFAITFSTMQFNKGKRISAIADDFIFDNKHDFDTKTFFGISDQLSVNYKLSEKFSIQIQTDLGIDMQDRITPDPIYHLEFAHLGIGIGGKYRW